MGGLRQRRECPAANGAPAGLVTQGHALRANLEPIMKSAAFLLFSLAAYAQAPAPTPLARLESNIRRVTNSVNATWGIYIKCLETGEEIAIGADRQMDTMSVIKIPLMAEA